MTDGYGREIDYLRISVTDRCDLRCIYCMPENGVKSIPRAEILTYEEIIRIVRLLSTLGIKKVRLTGGEPLLRKDLPKLVYEIKKIQGIKKVYITTNGMLLKENLPVLTRAGLDGVNISIDALSEKAFEKICRRSGSDKVLASIDAALSYPRLRVKLNCVPIQENYGELLPMVRHFLSDGRLSLRFIEMMPIGMGKQCLGIPEKELKSMLESEFGELIALPNEEWDGPSKYYRIGNMPGQIGFISALSHAFCSECNRIRLRSDGFLKTCLQYDLGVQLKPLLAQSDSAVLEAVKTAVEEKPEHHCFRATGGKHLEQLNMSRIGG